MGNMCQQNKDPSLSQSRRRNKTTLMTQMSPSILIQTNPFNNSQTTSNNSRLSQLSTTRISIRNSPSNLHLPPPLLSQPPRSLSNFRIMKILSQSFSSTIVQVKDLVDQTFYAMKIICKKFLKSQDNGQNNLNNKYFLESIDFPFVAKVRYAFQSVNKVYVIVDYATGGALVDLLEKSQKFDEDVCKYYSAQILMSLEYLHKNGICLGYIKSDRILLDRQGNIKLVNFGLRKIFKGEDRIFCDKRIDTISPQMVKSNKPTQVSDWFSFGVLIFSMLTGTHPFSNKLFNLMSKQQVQIPPNISEDATSLLQGLLLKDPKQRLGVNGCDEIKKHPFFKRTKFDEILGLKSKPPGIFQQLMDDKMELQSLKQSSKTCSFYHNAYPKGNILVDTVRKTLDVNNQEEDEWKVQNEEEIRTLRFQKINFDQ